MKDGEEVQGHLRPGDGFKKLVQNLDKVFSFSHDQALASR
jgi:hypothetical protein